MELPEGITSTCLLNIVGHIQGLLWNAETVLAGSEVLCLQHKTQEFTKCVERTIELKVNPKATLRIFTHKQAGIHDKKGKGKGGLDKD